MLCAYTVLRALHSSPLEPAIQAPQAPHRTRGVHAAPGQPQMHDLHAAHTLAFIANSFEV